MSRTRHRKPARWALAVGLPGRPPSPQARTLAASPHTASLPAGVWHISADTAAQLASTTPVVSDATHIASGARFRLLSVPDGPILGLSAGGEAARALVAAAWDDPTGWANRQTWRIGRVMVGGSAGE